ncbi:hypothetical protein [Spirillospora sp. NPDC047279]|uniref:hypothetical protein n=1 Tax=Spirillospora sp. NPDC047279 TaxID=3155478 RepID=UPI0033C26D6D
MSSETNEAQYLLTGDEDEHDVWGYVREAVGLFNSLGDGLLVAAAFGMNPEGVMIYLADRVNEGLLPEPPTNS